MAVYGSGSPGPQGYTPKPTIRFEIIGEAWKLVQEQMGTWVGAVLITFIVGFIVRTAVNMIIAPLLGMSAAATAPTPGSPPDPNVFLNMLPGLIGVGLISTAVSFVVNYFFMGGMFRMAIKQMRGEPIAIGDLFSATDVLPSLLVLGILSSIAYMAGFVCFILPGFVVVGLLSLGVPLVVDQQMKPVEAMSRSWNTLKGDWLMATLLVVCLGIVSGLGMLLCGVGYLFTAPILTIGIALIYRDYVLSTSAGGLGYVTAGAGYPGNAPYSPAPSVYPPPVRPEVPLNAPPSQRGMDLTQTAAYTPPPGPAAPQAPGAPLGGYAPPPPPAQAAPPSPGYAPQQGYAQQPNPPAPQPLNQPAPPAAPQGYTPPQPPAQAAPPLTAEPVPPAFAEPESAPAAETDEPKAETEEPKQEPPSAV